MTNIKLESIKLPIWFLCVGISSRFLQTAVTPFVQILYFNFMVSISFIIFIRSLIQTLFSIITFLLWIKIISSTCHNNYTIHKFVIHIVVFYALILSALAKLTLLDNYSLYILSLPLEWNFSIAYLLSNSYDLSSISYTAFFPAIFAPYLYLLPLPNNTCIAPTI